MIKEYYEGYWQKFNPKKVLWYEKIRRNNSEGNILDVGCGKFNPQLGGYYGVDIVDQGWNQVCDISKDSLPYNNSFFDTVTCMETLEHLFDPIHALAEINRVLKFEGRLIISVPNIANIFSRIALLFGIFSDFCDFQLVPGHIRFFTKRRMEKILHLTGFKVEKFYGGLFRRNMVFICSYYKQPTLLKNTYQQRGLQCLKF